MRKWQRVFSGIFALCVVSCATYQGKVEKARNWLETGSYNQALAQLKPLADKPSNDQLIYLLDYATTLQVAGQFEESNSYFHKADKMADIQDYTSLSLETGSFLLGEEMVQYKGEDFELLLINALSAINYLNLNQFDEALVEVRRLNEKLRRYRLEAKRKFTDNALALYLSGLIYEATHQWDDAAIAYEEVFKIYPNYSPLGSDLIRVNTLARRSDAARTWKARFPYLKESFDSKRNKTGEVIIIYQQGWGPRKNFRPENFHFPAMYPVWALKSEIEPELRPISPVVMGSLPPSVSVSTPGLTFSPSSQVLFDVDDIAVKSLDSQYAALVARRIGGVFVKAAVAERIRKDNPLLGDLTYLAMNIADRADLRQWSTLPKTFKIYRKTVPEGEYSLFIDGQEERSRLVVKAGAKVFVSHRTFR